MGKKRKINMYNFYTSIKINKGKKEKRDREGERERKKSKHSKDIL